MNSWSYKRKIYILIAVLFFLGAFLGFPVYFFLNRPATCTDGKQNGEETGIDCGGSCKLVCKSEALPILMKGDPRVFKLSTSTYAVALEAENPNTGAEIYRASYILRMYEKDSPVPIQTIEDSTFVPANSTFAVYIGPINLSSSTPYRATFEWKENEFNWNKTSNTEMPLTIDAKNIETKGTSRLNAKITNASLKDVSNIELVALVFDENGKISTASKTFVETLAPNEQTSVVFTWPSDLGTTTQIEILPRILPDRSFIK